MQITLGEYLKECESFPYSLEYYEIIKEGKEIDLLGLYLENYEYISICKEYEKEIHESVNFTEATEEVINEKQDSLIKKILNGIVKIFKLLIKPFTAIATLVRELINRIKNKTVKSKEEIEKIEFVLPEVVEQDPKTTEKVAKIIVEFMKDNRELYENIRAEKEDMVFKDSNTDVDATNKKVLASVNLQDKSQKAFMNKLVNFAFGHYYLIPSFFFKLQATADDIKKYYEAITPEKPASIKKMRKFFDKHLNSLKNSLYEKDGIMTYNELNKFADGLTAFKEELERISEAVKSTILNFDTPEMRRRFNKDFEALRDLYSAMTSFITFINASMKNIYQRTSNVAKEHEAANKLLHKILDLFKK